jgi:hypothetical protein
VWSGVDSCSLAITTKFACGIAGRNHGAEAVRTFAASSVLVRGEQLADTAVLPTFEDRS